MSELPEGWTSCEIGEVTKIVAGGTPPSKVSVNFQREGGIPWITPADLSGYRNMYISAGARNLSEAGYSACSASKLPAGSVLFSSRAPIGYVAIAKNEISTNQGFKSFVLPDELESRFVYQYLRHIKPLAESVATGTTFKELSASAAAKLPIVVAPLAEQKRIADKLDKVLTHVDACRDHLNRIPLILKRFRQSVLAAAMSGELTAEVFEDRKIAHRWTEKTIGEIAFVTKLAGFEYTDYVKYCQDGDLKVLKAENVGKFGFRHTVFSTVNSNEVAMLTRSIVFEGDLLMVFVGAGTGQVAVIPRGNDWFLGPNIALIRADEKIANAKYLEHYCRSPTGRSEVEKFVKSTAQPSLSMTSIRQIGVNLPSLEEQKEIVRQIEKLFDFADRLEVRLANARTAAERLTPAFLAKAFRGELVPQDPNDEPASELLKRLASSRSANGKKPRLEGAAKVVNEQC